MIITVNDLQKFTGVFPDEEMDLQDLFVGAACDIVENYLGYKPEEKFETVPALIRLTALRIAGILQTENNNNIGISSKSFQNEGTRTFVNTTDFTKYLIQISDYKIFEDDKNSD